MALLAGTGLALFAWVNQSLQTANRVRDTEQQARLLLNAHALVQGVNPMLTPAGEITAGPVKLNWRSEAVEAPRRNASFGMGMPGPWMVGLYRLQVSARDEATSARVDFMQLRTGERRVSAVATAP